MNTEWRIYDWQSQKVAQKGEVLNGGVYPCGFCKGKGLIPRKKSTRCSVCSGTGKISIAGPAVICGYCNGNGSSHLNRELTCIICKGKGVVTIGSNNIEICTSCNGRGREKGMNLPCSVCKGIGAAVRKDEDKENKEAY